MKNWPVWLKALVAVAVVAALVGGAQLMLYMDKLGDVKHGLG
jgi:hypothetical protein